MIIFVCLFLFTLFKCHEHHKNGHHGEVTLPNIPVYYSEYSLLNAIENKLDQILNK